MNSLFVSELLKLLLPIRILQQRRKSVPKLLLYKNKRSRRKLLRASSDTYLQPRGRLLATCLTQTTVSGFNDRVIVSGKPDYLSFALPASYFANLTITPR